MLGQILKVVVVLVISGIAFLFFGNRNQSEFSVSIIQTGQPLRYKINHMAFKDMKVLADKKFYYSYTHNDIAQSAAEAKELAENALKDSPDTIIAIGQYAAEAMISVNNKRIPIIYITQKDTIIDADDHTIGILICHKNVDQDILTSRTIAILEKLARGEAPKELKTKCLRNTFLNFAW